MDGWVRISEVEKVFDNIIKASDVTDSEAISCMWHDICIGLIPKAVKHIISSESGSVADSSGEAPHNSNITAALNALYAAKRNLAEGAVGGAQVGIYSAIQHLNGDNATS